MKYEKRVVAFIDILGFRALLEETVDKSNASVEVNIDKVIDAYKAIRDVLEADFSFENSDTSTSKQVSIFSDCIVVSFLLEEQSQIFNTLLDIKHLIMRLVYRRILCRGAVSIGKCIHTQDFLFGPALVEAYSLESNAAMYPRIILDRNVIEAGARFRASHHSSNQELKYVESLLEKDSDGMYYIDYFSKAQPELDDPEYGFPQYIEILGDIIRKGLMGSSGHGKASIRIKYLWMRERYNRMVEIVTEKKAIESLRQTGEPELADFYDDLKKISPERFKSD